MAHSNRHHTGLAHMSELKKGTDWPKKWSRIAQKSFFSYRNIQSYWSAICPHYELHLSVQNLFHLHLPWRTSTKSPTQHKVFRTLKYLGPAGTSHFHLAQPVVASPLM